VTHRPFPLRALAGLLLVSGADLGRAQQPAPGGDEWKYDVVYRKKGEPFRGFVHEQTDRYVDITVISRKPGRPTILFNEQVPRQDVEKVELLDPRERDLLHKRLDALKKERALLAARMKLLDPGSKPASDAADVLTLKAVPWPPEPSKSSLCYQSTHFRLVSSARDEFAQLAAIELEQVYSAYARVLPPRTSMATPTTVLLTASYSEYQALVRNQGGNFLNPAFFDPAKNQVVCGSDLQRLCDQLEKIREFHAKRRKELADEEAELKAAYKNKVPPALLAEIESERDRIKQAEERNTAGYHQERLRMFRRLYHEAFHAYLNTFVYPPEEGELPRWFNEGLAQVFEESIFEVGELRTGHAEKEQVDAIRQAIIHDTLLPVADILRSGARQFQVAHTSEKQKADRFYIASWGLAHYVTFNRHVLGTKAMDEYVRSLKRGTDPVEAFTTLVGQPLPEFQKQFVDYLTHLKGSQ
jgi:hypothetical protein